MIKIPITKQRMGRGDVRNQSVMSHNSISFQCRFMVMLYENIRNDDS